MSKVIVEAKNPVCELDYAGWESVDFSTMKWKYDDGHPCSKNERKIKRTNGKWFIKDDHDEWVDYEMGNGEEEMLEGYYQEYIGVIGEAYVK